MSIKPIHVALFVAVLPLAACSSPDGGADRERDVVENAADQDRVLVENAIRDAYEAEGAEVTDVTMELSPDGSRYIGRATVRDPESGTELTVDCRYTTDAGGTPRLNCDRVTDEAGEAEDAAE